MDNLRIIYGYGWWFSFNPSEKYESQLGWLFPIYGRIKHVPNHQPEVHVGSFYCLFLTVWFLLTISNIFPCMSTISFYCMIFLPSSPHYPRLKARVLAPESQGHRGSVGSVRECHLFFWKSNPKFPSISYISDFACMLSGHEPDTWSTCDTSLAQRASQNCLRIGNQIMQLEMEILGYVSPPKGSSCK